MSGAIIGHQSSACARAYHALVYRNGEDTRLRINLDAEEERSRIRISFNSKILQKKKTNESTTR